MNNTNSMKNISWTTFKERSKDDLIIISSGAFEAYGPHLPLGTDTLVSVKLAELIAEQVNAVIGPTIEVGDSSAIDDFPGTITIRPETFKLYLEDIVSSIIKWGFKKILFINGHAGNVPMITQVSRQWRENKDIHMAQIDVWRFIKAQDDGVLKSGEFANGHAGEAGTSVMQYLYPDLVDNSKLVDEIPKSKDLFSEIIKYQKFSTKTEFATIGYSTQASKEKGENLVKYSVDRVVKFLNEVWGIPKK